MQYPCLYPTCLTRAVQYKTHHLPLESIPSQLLFLILSVFGVNCYFYEFYPQRGRIFVILELLGWEKHRWNLVEFLFCTSRESIKKTAKLSPTHLNIWHQSIHSWSHLFLPLIIFLITSSLQINKLINLTKNAVSRQPHMSSAPKSTSPKPQRTCFYLPGYGESMKIIARMKAGTVDVKKVGVLTCSRNQSSEWS